MFCDQEKTWHITHISSKQVGFKKCPKSTFLNSPNLTLTYVIQLAADLNAMHIKF